MSRAYRRRVFLAGAAGAAVSLSAVAPKQARAVGPVGLDVPVRPEAIADPAEATLAEAAVMIRTGGLTSVRLVEALLSRIDTYEPVYQAFNTVCADVALATARLRDQGRPGTLLHGIPVAVKDNFRTAGVLTTANSFLFDDLVPTEDATAVRLLQDAGAVLLGKTQMGPLATTRATRPDGTITTVNAWTPHDPGVDPGGSSTGSATAVAARLATVAIGTQTGGSITLPANAQNLTGLKPTQGRISLHGVLPLNYSRDVAGPIARDVLDAALLLTHIAGEDHQDVRTRGLPPLPNLVKPALVSRDRPRLRRPTRIGVPPDYLAGPAAEQRRTLLDALARIRGASLVEVVPPEEWAALTSLPFANVRLAERVEPYLPHLKSDLRAFGAVLLGWLPGALLSGDEFIAGQRAKVFLLDRLFAGLFQECDVVLQDTPTAFDILGLPLVGFPIGFRSGLPAGATLGGQPYEEDRLVEVVAAYQAATDWHWRRPRDPDQDRPHSSRVRGRTDPLAVLDLP